jgi:DHA1 family bicyclomycin/chloramphenicol resistance-like MFS transporter
MRNVASSERPGAPRSEVSLVLVLGALAAFGPLAIDTYLPAFPAIARDLHARAQAVDWTLAV